MTLKLYDGEFQVFDVHGLNVYILSSISKGIVDVYVNYPNYGHMMLIHGVEYEDYDIEDTLMYIDTDFINIMKQYFIELEKLEEMS